MKSCDFDTRIFSWNFFLTLIMAGFLWANFLNFASAGVQEIHPKLMNQAWINDLKLWSNDSEWQPWIDFQQFANGNFNGGPYDAARLFAKALMWKMEKGDNYLTDCLNNFDRIVDSVVTTTNIKDRARMISLAYDLLYDQLPSTSQMNAVDKFIEWQDIIRSNGTVARHFPLWNYAIELWVPTMIASAVGVGDPSNNTNDLSSEYLYWKTKYLLPALYWLENAIPGDMPEGTYYGTVKNTRYLLQAVDTVFMAENENLYSQYEWFEKRLTLEWQTYHSLPKKYNDVFSNNRPGRYFHPWGHSERFRFTTTHASRINTLILLSRLPSHPYKNQIYYSLFKNADPDLNNMVNREIYNAAILAFIYGAKELDNTATPPTLQGWATNVNSLYGIGKVFLRSGYDTDDIAISFKAGDMFNRGHENLEEGTFQIFAKGEDLAIHSGSYAGSGEFPQTLHYWSSTVSTNSLIIYDPDEKFWFVGKEKDNDGGQRTYTDYPQWTPSSSEVASILNGWASGSESPSSNPGSNPDGVNHHGKILKLDVSQKDYSFVYSDITFAYNSEGYIEGMNSVGNSAKVKKVTREIVLLDNKYITIFDKIAKTRSTDYAASPLEGQPYPYQDKWLLHTQTTFNVDGIHSTPSTGEDLYNNSNGSFSTIVNNSALYGQIVHPTNNFQIRKFNGTKRYWNYNKNILYGYHSSNPADSSNCNGEDDPYVDCGRNQGMWYNKHYGEDRLEIEPTDTNLEHYYLVVLYPEYVNGPNMPEIVPINVVNGPIKGTQIKDTAKNIIAVFGADMSTDIVTSNIEYAVSSVVASKHYIFDMKSNINYSVSINGLLINVQSSEAGTITFDTNSVGDLNIAITSVVMAVPTITLIQ